MMSGACEKTPEVGAKMSVLKDLLGRMYKLMGMDPKAEAMEEMEEEDEEEGMSLADMEAERAMESMSEPKKKKPKYAMLSMSVEAKPAKGEAPKMPMASKGKRYA
jgi:hypothetical protein